jgi:sialic acid synthase SpsE
VTSAGSPEFAIAGRRVGRAHPPLVIAEIGINHEGHYDKAIRMVDDDEMIPNDVVPGNTTETIWNIMVRCALSEDEERALKKYVEDQGLIYLCTPFSRAAADRLEAMNVVAYKIGSGECNNYPLIKHIARRGKPVLLSTGMNDVVSVTPAVEILRQAQVPFALFHCTSMYPTPYKKVRLGALTELASAFPDAVLGLSDHSLGNYTCFAAVPLGASLLEKHFTSDKSWPGPDVPISMDPKELKELVEGSRAIHEALGGGKTILPEEKPTIDFAYACVVTTRDIAQGETASAENLWVKRPGTGEIKAVHYEQVLGRQLKRALPRNAQLRWDDLA